MYLNRSRVRELHHDAESQRVMLRGVAVSFG